MKFLLQIFFCFLFIFISKLLPAQSPDSSQIITSYAERAVPDSLLKLKINSIIITGNRKTKEFIIKREIQFKPGDSIYVQQLEKELDKARQQIYNTTLFDDVTVTTISNSSSEMDVVVKVKERWYLFPIPQFKLIDRNINEWLVNHNADLSRVSYGVKFIHYNLTGRKDQLKIYLTNGYTRNISFAYTFPYSNATLTDGFLIGGGYAQQKETTFKTSYDNKQQIYSPGEFTKKNKSFYVGYSIRKAIKNRHVFIVKYNNVSVLDSIAKPEFNVNYLRDSANSRSFVDISYSFSHAYVDNISYPLKGIVASATILKRGWGLKGGVDMLSVEGNFARYFSHKKNWNTSVQLFSKIILPFEQAYINQQALGYGENYLRGLEYYVIESVAFSYAKFNLKKKILTFNIPVPFKNRWVNKVPFTFFAKTYADIGYAYNKKEYNTNLNNKFLYTGGFGIDILSLYDMSMRIEYSFNQLGQNGLFLQTQIGFR